MGIVWLASYPKSGNTWLRFLLANYFLGDVPSSRLVASCIPDLHVAGQFPPSQPWRTPAGHLLVKTHFAFGPRHPEVSRTAALVYIIRHPKDVLLSSLNHRRLEGEQLVRAIGAFSDEQYGAAFIRAGGDPLWLRLGYGTWESHAASWLDGAGRAGLEQRPGIQGPHLTGPGLGGPAIAPAAPGVPGGFRHLRIRYCDLRSDPAAALAPVLRLLGEEPDPARMSATIGRSSFERLRRLELREKEAGESYGVFPGQQATLQRGVFFMNKGKAGQTLAGISPRLDALFDRRFAAAIATYWSSRAA